MFPPNAARSPVKGRTSPIFSVNEQFALACACEGLAVEAAAPTEMATAAIAIAAAARVTLIDLSTGLPPLDLAGVPQSPRLENVGTLTDLPLRRKGRRSYWPRPFSSGKLPEPLFPTCAETQGGRPGSRLSRALACRAVVAGARSA